MKKVLFCSLLIFVITAQMSWGLSDEEVKALLPLRMATAPEKVSSVTLRMFYDSGVIHGYVIFRNQEGEMCAVHATGNDKYKTAILTSSSSLIKDLGSIKISDFGVYTLKSGDEVLAYPIRLIPLKLYKGQTRRIEFEWIGFTAGTEVANLWDDTSYQGTYDYQDNDEVESARRARENLERRLKEDEYKEKHGGWRQQSNPW